MPKNVTTSVRFFLIINSNFIQLQSFIKYLSWYSVDDDWNSSTRLAMKLARGKRYEMGCAVYRERS